MKRLAVLLCLITMVLFSGAPALAAQKSIDDPVGDTDLGPDIQTFTVDNAQKALTFRLDYASPAANPIHYAITMKWGAGAKKKCSFGNGSGGAVPHCNADGTSTPPTSCGSFTLSDDGMQTVAKLPRRCIKKAADTMKFKVVATYTGACVNCGTDPDAFDWNDNTAWTPLVKRG